MMAERESIPRDNTVTLLADRDHGITQTELLTIFYHTLSEWSVKQGHVNEANFPKKQLANFHSPWESALEDTTLWQWSIRYKKNKH